MGDYIDALPSATYEITAEDGVMHGISFAAYRRTATHLLVKVAGRFEWRPIDQHDLNLTPVQDQDCSTKLKNSEAALSPSEDII